jgi:hypothetical protein
MADEVQNEYQGHPQGTPPIGEGQTALPEIIANSGLTPNELATVRTFTPAEIRDMVSWATNTELGFTEANRKRALEAWILERGIRRRPLTRDEQQFLGSLYGPPRSSSRQAVQTPATSRIPPEIRRQVTAASILAAELGGIGVGIGPLAGIETLGAQLSPHPRPTGRATTVRLRNQMTQPWGKPNGTETEYDATLEDLIDLEQVKKLGDQAITAIRRDFMNGAIPLESDTKQSARSALRTIGVVEHRVEEYLSAWNFLFDLPHRANTAAAILNWGADSIIDIDEVEQRLHNLGYSDDDVQNMIEEKRQNPGQGHGNGLGERELRPTTRRTTTTRSSGGYQGGAFYGSPFGSMQFGAGFPGFAVPQNFPTLFQPQGQSPLPENPPPIYNQFQVSPTIPAPRVYPPLQSSEPTPGSVYSNPPPEPPG